MTVIRRGRNRIARKRFLLILLFIIVGLIVSLITMLSYYKSRRDSEANRAQVPDRIYGVVLMESIGSQEVLREEQLREVELTNDACQLNVISKEMAVGKQVRIDLRSDTLLTEDMLMSDEKLPNDLRRHAYHFIHATDHLVIGDYVDIRIAFKNGADFIVLSKKRVLDYTPYNAQTGTENSLWIELTEEEILRLSSAAVDAYYNIGSSIYAIEYVDESQEKALVDYPVNDVVSELIKKNPNIIEEAKASLSNPLRSSVTMPLEEYENAQANTSDLSYEGESSNDFLMNGDKGSASYPSNEEDRAKVGQESTDKDKEEIPYYEYGKEGDANSYVD